MNRADLLYSVLQDGREHSRADIVSKVGFFLTNNAASELRARGIGVEHRVTDGLHTYKLLSAAGTTASPSSLPPVAPSSLASNPTDGALVQHRDGAGQLALHIPRSTYEEAA